MTTVIDAASAEAAVVDAQPDAALADAALADAALVDAAPVDAALVDAAPRRCDPTAPFGAPLRLASLGTSAAERNATLTADELTIFFISGRAGGPGGGDIYTASRASTGDAFGPATLVPISTAQPELDVTVSGDGRRLIVTYAPSLGDLYVSTRASLTAAFPALAPLAGFATSADEGSPEVGAATGALYLSANVGGRYGVLVAASTGTGFGAPVPLAAINTGQLDGGATLTGDELTIYWTSTRNGAALDIYRATRPSVGATFTGVAPVAELNATTADEPNWVSPDGCAIYLHSNRSGNDELYVATRPR